MKNQTLLLATAGLLLICATIGYAGWCVGIYSQALSHDEATGIALAYLGRGTLKSARLDRSDRLPVWEVNVLQPDKINVSEVDVHALTGAVLRVRTEPLRKANRELADVAKHIGILPEHVLPPLPAKQEPEPIKEKK